MAAVMDGVYETAVGPDGSILVNVKSLDLAQAQRLAAALESVSTPEQAAELAEVEDDPQLREILTGIANNQYTVMLVGALVTLLIKMLGG